ncbi:MAG: peptidylprolyl isomerase [Candidatus Marithrix sp.]
MKYFTIFFLLTVTVYADEAPIVNLHTNFGLIVLELNPAKAPKTVATFLKYANSNFYDDTVFHRVIKKYIIQGGGYTKDYQKKIHLYDPIINESNNNLENLYGTIAMARSYRDPDSATSQFFINLKDNLSLDYNDITEEMGYTVFGKVIEGMDIVEKIQYFETGAGGSLKKHVPQEQVIIEVVVVKNMAGTRPIKAIEESTGLNAELANEMDEDYLEIDNTQIENNIAISDTKENVSKLTNDNIIESNVHPKIELLTVNFKIPVTEFTSKKIPIVNTALEKISLNRKITSLLAPKVISLSAPDMPSQPDISDPFPY